MKELLEALKLFGEKPESLGDNLFAAYAAINHMSWQDTMAAGAAIWTLKEEASDAAIRQQKASVSDPTYCRLSSCMIPVIARLGQLMAEAPKEKQPMLYAAACATRMFRSGTTAEWAKQFASQATK